MKRILLALFVLAQSCDPLYAAGPIIWGPSSASKDISTNGLTTPKLQITETGGGTDTVSFVVPSIASNWTFTLPTTGGTNNYVMTTNGSGTASWSQVSLTAGVTGTLPIGNGGTNATTAQTAIDNLAGAVTDNRVLQGDGSHIVLGQIDSNSFFTSGAAAGVSTYGVTKASNKQVSNQADLSATSDGSTSATSSQMQVNITTTGGYVEVILAPDGSTSSGGIVISRASGTRSGSVRILRDGTVIARRTMSSSGGDVTYPNTISVIDSPASGTYQYQVDCIANVGTQTCEIQKMKLYAIEKW